MQPLNVCELESLIYTVDIVQLHLTISYLNSFLQSVLLLLMFIEVIVVMARNDYHPRVLRALRPIFFINSQLMYAMRRWTLMMYHAFNNYVSLSIHKLESMTTEWKASCSWVYMCSYYKASHILIYPLYLNRVMKEIFKVFTTILDVILLLLFLIVIFSIFGKHNILSPFQLSQEFDCVLQGNVKFDKAANWDYCQHSCFNAASEKTQN